MTVASLSMAALALAGFWLFGGLVARVGGALLMLAGLVGVAAISDANGPIVFVLGAGMWLAGYWHYALRHGGFKSTLAEQLLSRFVRE
jgi:hypothetical protein